MFPFLSNIFILNLPLCKVPSITVSKEFTHIGNLISDDGF